MLKAEALQLLETKISACEKCESLCEYRKNEEYLTVPGEGNPNASIMIIGEAPGQNEAEEGSPFIGKAGRLLTKIIEACGWTREDVFITNILKCRPPGNRDPEKDEADNCRQYLNLQIKIIEPEWILCFGRIASINLLGTNPDKTMGSFRHEVHEYEGKKVVCTYHPSYLLRQPSAKEEVWKDLAVVRESC